MKKKVRPIGTNWADLGNKILTPEEIAESDLRVALVGEIIKARQTQGYTQKRLEELTGVKQPVIARLERGITDPQLSTIMKLMAPLGKKLAVVPLEYVPDNADR